MYATILFYITKADMKGRQLVSTDFTSFNPKCLLFVMVGVLGLRSTKLVDL